MLVDAHAHLDKYPDHEVDLVLNELERTQMLTLSVSVDVASFERTEVMASRSRFVVPGFGIHPSEAPRYVDELAGLEKLIDRSPFLGEIGLDHRFVTNPTHHEPQRRVFGFFLEQATSRGKLVNVHCAGAEREVADMLEGHAITRAIIHWYAGPLDVLDDLIASGYSFTVGPQLQFSDHIRTIARSIPGEQLLTETDNPGGFRWLTGRAGYPTLLADLVGRLAEVRRVTPEALTDSVHANLQRLGDDYLTPWLGP